MTGKELETLVIVRALGEVLSLLSPNKVTSSMKELEAVELALHEGSELSWDKIRGVVK